MELLWIYLSGYFLIAIVSYFVLCNSKDQVHSKKYLAYQSMKLGALSWIGILFMLTAFVVDACFRLNDEIEKKLDK